MTAWLDDAACRGHGVNPAWFFGNEAQMLLALAVCRQCPAIQRCRADAEAHGDIRDGHTTHGQVVGGCAPWRSGRAPGMRYWSKLEPCGTVAAYKRHLRRGEPVCAPCREAERLAKAEQRARTAS